MFLKRASKYTRSKPKHCSLLIMFVCDNRFFFLDNVCATCLTTTWHESPSVGHWQQTCHEHPKSNVAKSSVWFVWGKAAICIVRWRQISNQCGRTLDEVANWKAQSHQKAIEKPHLSQISLSPLRDIYCRSQRCRTYEQEWQSTIHTLTLIHTMSSAI